MAKLRELFKIDSSYTDDQARTIAGVRYELAVKSLTDAQYVFADDVSVELISQTADGQYQGYPPAPPPPGCITPNMPPMCWGG